MLASCWRILMSRILCLILLLCCLTSHANNARQAICMPCINDEFMVLLEERNVAQRQYLGDEIVDGAFSGFSLPWMGTFALGIYLSSKLNEENGFSCSVNEGIAGGVCSCVCLSPIALLASLPLGLASMSYSAVKWLILQINAAKNEKEIITHLNLHLYRWIDVIKKGRQAIREELIDYQKRMGESDGKFSLAAAANQILRGKQFNDYFAFTSFDQPALFDLLSKIEKENDDWESFFNRMGELIRTPELNEEQWQMLEQRLISFKPDELSAQDIKEYLPFAVYFISLSQKYLMTILTI